MAIFHTNSMFALTSFPKDGAAQENKHRKIHHFSAQSMFTWTHGHEDGADDLVETIDWTLDCMRLNYSL
jgi:hypothetical protein